ncbi:ABC transporter transmembrane domain-containing protein [Limoniibacter endophyticus]|uniref:ABC transporter n=1 Tax=Limoniibacter endophyticus TaxID=1565040 RepID=A0A8J3DKH9_9HYPH|nr:ABC transporter transmembrane domain-containing protein [Limoniibacter endophyticus]GHC76862.1 ABC transporter [Limoniibacter endophyticus]
MRKTGNPGRAKLGPLMRLKPYLLRYRGRAATAFFFLTLAGLTTLTLPLAVRRVIDHGFSEANSTFISNYFSVLVVIAAILALASAGRYYFVMTLGERVVADIRRNVFAHITTLSPAFFDREQSGEIVSRLTADTTQIRSMVGATLSVALRNVILGTGAVTMMVVTSPKLSALVLAAIPVIIIPLVAFGRSVRKRSREAQDTLAASAAFASEQIGAIRTVQAFTHEEKARSRFAAAVEGAFDAARGTAAARALLTFIAIFTVLSSVVAVLWFGSRDVLSGVISAGTLGQFVLYSVFAAGALGALSEIWGELAQTAGALERIGELLDEEPAITVRQPELALPEKPDGAIALEDVSFAYPGRPDLPALQHIALAIQPGERVAIVGASGAGKSTLFSLLLRYYDPANGRILIDGTDIAQVDPQGLRQSIAIVPQDVTVFAATARENIAFGRPEASQEEIEAAAKAAHAHEFIEKMAYGYDTMIGERGITLSGGQRQRIAIARAILRNAPILLLDEATSALDAESEMLVQDALDRLMTGRTTLVIAHRLATVLKADRIVVIDEGRIVEEGTHDSLVRRDGPYARLARLQFESGAQAFRGAAE